MTKYYTKSNINYGGQEEDYIQRKVAEFKEIQKESFMTATAKPLLLQPEAVVWYEEILIETIAQALAEERERMREIIKEKGHQQEDGTIWVNMDDLLSSLDKPLTDK